MNAAAAPVPAPYQNWLRRYHPLLLALAWAGMQVACWRYYHGPQVYGDSVSYLGYALRLLTFGRFASGHFGQYSGYIGFLALFLKLGFGPGLWAAALAQVALSGLAATAFYRTAYHLVGDHWPTAALATAGLVTWLSIQAFNPVLLTESVFTSSLIVSAWAVLRLQPGQPGRAALALVLLLGTATLRPNGFIAVAAALLAGIGLLWRRGHRAWAAVGLLAGLGLGLQALSTAIVTFKMIDGYAEGAIIFGYWPASLAPPTTLQVPAATARPLVQWGWFVSHNFGYFCRLCAAKTGYFLGYPRPWYSLGHRVWAFTVLPLVYGLALAGALRRAVAIPARMYLAAAILLQLGIVVLTTEDWDARFSAPLIPYWLLLAASGMRQLPRSWRPAANAKLLTTSGAV